MFSSIACNFCKQITRLSQSTISRNLDVCNSSKFLQQGNTYVITLRAFTPNVSHDDPALLKVRRAKKLFAAVMFTITFGVTYYLNRMKGKKMKDIFEDCQRLQIDYSLFEAKVSLFKYKDFIFPGEIIKSGVLKNLDSFQFREKDVIVSSFPKTGTTWVQEIVYMLSHGCEVTGQKDEVLETRFPYLEYPYPGIKSIAKKEGPRCIKTHLPYSLLPSSFDNSGSKLIYVTRNPRDTAVSYFHFSRLLTMSAFKGNLEEFTNLFMTDKVAYAPFFDHVKEYWNRKNDPNILFITYEQLHENPSRVIQKIATFLEIPVSEEDINFISYHTSFKSMSNNPSVNYEHWKDVGFAFKDRGSFLRKGNVGSWKEEMSSDLIEKFEKWENLNLDKTGIEFTFSTDPVMNS